MHVHASCSNCALDLRVQITSNLNKWVMNYLVQHRDHRIALEVEPEHVVQHPLPGVEREKVVL